MKKIKLMLTVVAAVGMTGGVLAFKAKIFGSTKYCYTTTTAAGAQCILTLNDGEFLSNGTGNYKYATIPAGAHCPISGSSYKTAKSIGI